MSRLLLFIFIPFYTFSQSISSITLENSWTISEIELMYNLSFLPSYVANVNFEVNAYKILYNTNNENGEPVLASGVIYMPINTICPPPVLSWQHGTIVADSSAPSQNIDNSILGILLATDGYIVIMSDYLGLGEGDGYHNYCHSETESSSVIDLIFATHEFLDSESIEASNQTFLMGYSQGGHATMATVKKIESSFSEEIVITASSPMAGPYSMSEAQSEMLDVVYPNPGYFPYVIFSYQRIYGNLYNSTNEFFKSGFENLEELYNGTYSMDSINQTIWSIGESIYGIDQNEFTPLDMIKNDYYVDYQTNENHPFRLALQDNDLIDFVPQSPMKMIHCNGDDNVPYSNALIAYESFVTSGSSNVELIDLGNFNHADCSQVSIISAKLWFDSMINPCTSIKELKSDKKIVLNCDLLGRPVNASFMENKISFILYEDGSFKKHINLID